MLSFVTALAVVNGRSQENWEMPAPASDYDFDTFGEDFAEEPQGNSLEDVLTGEDLESLHQIQEMEEGTWRRLEGDDDEMRRRAVRKDLPRCVQARTHQTGCHTVKTTRNCPAGYKETSKVWHGCCNSFWDCFGFHRNCKKSGHENCREWIIDHALNHAGGDGCISSNCNLGQVCVDGHVHSFLVSTSKQVYSHKSKTGERCQ